MVHVSVSDAVLIVPYLLLGYAEQPYYTLYNPDSLSNTDPNWYAVKIYTERPEILKYLDSHRIEHFTPTVGDKPLFQSLYFIRCTFQEVLSLKSDWYRQMMVYRDVERKSPEAIPDAEMENFRKYLNIKGEEYVPLEVKDREFLKGQTVRVLDGPFKGATGVIRRLKGNRRLVVSVAGVAAYATAYVPKEFLEVITE